MYRVYGYLGASPDIVCFCRYVKKLEMGVGCVHSCVYCFVQDLRRELHTGSCRPLNVIGALDKGFQNKEPEFFDSLAFRLSTNTDPFATPYVSSGLTKRVMEWLLERHCELVIVTKSAHIVSSHHLDLLKQLSNEQLTVVTMTILSHDEGIRRILEPAASSIQKRLEAIKILKEEGVRVVARIQPLLPGINDDEEQLQKLVEELAESGAKHVVTEFLRLEYRIWQRIRPLIIERRLFKKYQQLYKIEAFDPKMLKFQSVVDMAYKISKLKLIQKLCRKYNVGFTACKEGVYELHSSLDCCGAMLHGVARPNGYEVYRLAKKHSEGIMWHDIEKLAKTTPYFKQLRKLWQRGVLARQILGLTHTKEGGETIYYFDKDQLERWGI